MTKKMTSMIAMTPIGKVPMLMTIQMSQIVIMMNMVLSSKRKRNEEITVVLMTVIRIAMTTKTCT